MNPTLNNPWNRMLQARRVSLANASRSAITPANCQPAIASSPAAVERQQRSQLLSVPVLALAAGDNQLIPTLTGKKLIYEVVLWNVGAQTLAFWQGPSASGILLTKFTNFPALTGFTLGFNGNFAMPHWEIDSGQPLVLNLSAGTEVDGFIRYKISSGST